MYEENKNYENEIIDTNITEETVYYEETNVEPDKKPKGTGKGPGIASLICGIISLIGCCGAWYVGIPCGIAAIICGIIQCVKNRSKGMAVAGIICGAIGIVMSIVVLVAVVIMIESGFYTELMKEFMFE